MTEKKFELTDKMVKIKDITYTQYRLLRDVTLKDGRLFKKGTALGYIQSETNLSQEDDSLILENCYVGGSSCVSENSIIEDCSVVTNCMVKNSTIRNTVAVTHESIIKNSDVINCTIDAKFLFCKKSTVESCNIKGDVIIEDSFIKKLQIRNKIAFFESEIDIDDVVVYRIYGTDEEGKTTTVYNASVFTSEDIFYPKRTFFAYRTKLEYFAAAEPRDKMASISSKGKNNHVFGLDPLKKFVTKELFAKIPKSISGYFSSEMRMVANFVKNTKLINEQKGNYYIIEAIQGYCLKEYLQKNSGIKLLNYFDFNIKTGELNTRLERAKLYFYNDSVNKIFKQKNDNPYDCIHM